MRQFQGSLGPLQELEGSRPPGPPRPSKNGSAAAVPATSARGSWLRKSKRHASPERLLDLCVLFIIGLVLLAAL